MVTKKFRAYRKGQLEATTRVLRDTVIDLGLNGGSLLDIGGGFGALTFELMDRGMTHATIVDASAAYSAMAHQEAVRRGRSKSTEVITGDVVELGSTLPLAKLVTLDRVVCCYPHYQPMLEEAARHAEQAVGLSYPRDRWFVRAGNWIDNVKRAHRTAFRTFVHPPSEIQAVVERAGFELSQRRMTVAWSIDVYIRRRDASP
jgi:magnesium-protoporphyrin O-methyltransferase